MDIISNAVERNQHLCKNIKMEEQTWEQFKVKKKGKQIFIFGCGGGMDYFLRNCCNHMKISGVVDNDKNKQNRKLGWYCAEAFRTEYEDITIESPDILKKYRKQDIIVLVTGINTYLPIVEQLKQMGVDNCYVLLMMEVNKRRLILDNIEEDITAIRNGYIDWCCCQKIENNKIVMLIGVYGDHARQITKALLKKKRNLDIVWLVSSLDIEKPEQVRLIYMGNWKRYIYEMETAKIWLFDDLVPGYIKKRQGQAYIQAKHWSSITLKKFYLDDKASHTSASVPDVIKRDGARMDYLLSGSKFDEASCRSGFMFSGRNVRVGSARSDILFDDSVRKKVAAQFGLGENAKICLYVPTYRLEQFRKTRSMSILLDMEALLDVLRDKWCGEWFLFVRIHPSLILEDSALPKSRNVINVQNYPYSGELVAASDLMITDYSSIMFEEAYRKKPVFLYAPDRQEYVDGERGLLIEYDTLPFPIATSNSELYQCIKEFQESEYEKSVTAFLGSYGIHEDGHASDRAAEFIMGILNGGKAMKDTEMILSYLADEESKFIYKKRLEFCETRNHNAIREIVNKYLPVLKDTYFYQGIENEIIEQLRNCNKEKIIVFGAGLNGKQVLELLAKANIAADAVVDNDESKWGKPLEGITIKAPQEIKDIANRCMFVITPVYKDIVDCIHAQLLSYGIDEDCFIDYRKYCFIMLNDEQYFDDNVIKYEPEEVFVDGGVLDLHTSIRFIHECLRNGTTKYKIYAYEPDSQSFLKCQNKLKDLPDTNIQLYNEGLWSSNTTLYFHGTGRGDARVVQQDLGESCQVISLDNVLADKVTFIKMDIEGAELEALKGSRKIIRKYKPKLAISIYHKAEDLTQIPLYIKELVPEYRLYIRHYSNSTCETILYAVL